MKKYNPFLFASMIGLLLASCNNDDSDQFDKELIPLFDQSVTAMIHGGGDNITI